MKFVQKSTFFNSFYEKLKIPASLETNKVALLEFLRYTEPVNLINLFTKLFGNAVTFEYQKSYYVFDEKTNYFKKDKDFKLSFEFYYTKLQQIIDELILLNDSNSSNNNFFEKIFEKIYSTLFHLRLVQQIKLHTKEIDESALLLNKCIFCFENCFYDFDTKQIIKPQMNMKLFIHCKNAFKTIDPTEYEEEFLHWSNYFCSIFDVSLGKQIMPILRSCIDPTVKNKKVFFLVGPVSCGKTFFCELLEEILTDVYAGFISSEIFNPKISSAAFKRTLLNISQKRLVFIDEPQNENTKKYIFDKISSSEGIFCSKSQEINAKLIISCNDLSIPKKLPNNNIKNHCNVLNMKKNLFKKNDEKKSELKGFMTSQRMRNAFFYLIFQSESNFNLKKENKVAFKNNDITYENIVKFLKRNVITKEGGYLQPFQILKKLGEKKRIKVTKHLVHIHFDVLKSAMLSLFKVEFSKYTFKDNITKLSKQVRCFKDVDFKEKHVHSSNKN